MLHTIATYKPIHINLCIQRKKHTIDDWKRLHVSLCIYIFFYFSHKNKVKGQIVRDKVKKKLIFNEKQFFPHIHKR